MINDLCIIALETEYTTNVKTNEKCPLLHVASDSIPRFKVYTSRKDAILGHLILSRKTVKAIVEAQETAKKHDYDQIRIPAINSPGMCVMWDTENSWVEAWTDYEHQPVKQLQDISVSVRQDAVMLVAYGEFCIEEADICCSVRFSWNITKAIRDGVRNLNAPIDTYNDEEFKYLQDSE